MTARSDSHDEGRPDAESAELIFRLGLFSGMTNAKARKTLLENRGALAGRKGHVFVHQGEYTGQFCVLVQGIAGVYRYEPGEPTRRLAQLGPGDWFGEMCALSNQPALATVEAETECVLVALDPPTFKTVYQNDDSFKAAIDARYRQRALAGHLRTVPLFKGLPESVLLGIQAGVELVVLEPKPGRAAVAAREGEEADSVWLVRSGAIKCSKRGARGEERILGYYMDNSSFGERALASTNRRWPGTYEAMGRTDLIRVPRALFEELPDRETIETLTIVADLIADAESGRATGVFDGLRAARRETGVSREKLEVMVAKESVKGGEALVIDLTKCTRCNACVESCVAVHDDRVPRLSKVGYRIAQDVVLSSACYNCEIPECMFACNYGAIRRDVRGSIDFVWDNCVGCTACVEKCPYDVIRMTPPSGFPPAVAPASLLANLPLIGKWFTPGKLGGGGSAEPQTKPAAPAALETIYNRATGKKEEVLGKAIKCDLCAGLPFEACVYNCPCGAIFRIEPEALFESEG